MASSSNSEATSKRKRGSSSEASPRRRMRLPSPTTDPSISSPTMAGSQASDTDTDTDTDADTVPETVPETAQLQQEDNDTVPEIGLDNVPQEDSEPVHETEQENVQEQDNGYNADVSNNEDNDMGANEDAEEEEQPATVAELRRLIRVVSRISYQEHNQVVVDSSLVGTIFADECDTWLQLSIKIRQLYYLFADREAAGDALVLDGLIAPIQSWPGRTLRYYSNVDGQVIERFWPQDNWKGLDLANNLDVVALDIPENRACRIVLSSGDGLEEELDRFVIQNMESWKEFAARIRVVFYREILRRVAPDLEEVSPLNCCPGNKITYWGDLREEWFFGSSTRDGRETDNWPAARLAICKVILHSVPKLP